MVTYVYEGKIKIYQPIEPRQLLNFIDEKKARLEKILPELEAKKRFVNENSKKTNDKKW